MASVLIACKHSISAPPGAGLGFPRERPPTPGTRGRQAVSTRFGIPPGAPVAPGLEEGWRKGDLPSTTSELAVLGKLAEAMANARLHSLNTKSALPTATGQRSCSPIFRQAGYRAGFTIPVWEWPEPARHGASAPCLGAAWGSLQ